MPQPTIEIPSVTLPKGGGAIRGIGETFTPDAFTGAGSLSLPVYNSPGRGFEPQLALDYSSGSGNGPFGVGFSLALAAIFIRTDKGIPRYEGSDTFALTGIGDLVVRLLQDSRGAWTPDIRFETVDGIQWKVTVYMAQTEGAFSLIEQWEQDDGTSWWKVVTRDNVTHRYGTSSDARIADPADKSHIATWYIEHSEDAVGNKILYRYKPENDENVPPAIYEQNRSVRANRYIESIVYGNYLDGDGNEHYAFEIVFDYGGYDLEHPDQPPGMWTARCDPFSTYRAGFEIRTFRLCQSILMFHRFADLFNGERFLVRATKLGYDESPAFSLLTSVQATGYRKRDDGSYETESLPPLRFGYSPFQPEGRTFTPLVVGEDTPIPGALTQGQFMPVDLHGEGLPGFLYSDDTTTLYWEPKGGGVYGYPESPVDFPIERDLGDIRYTLSDLDSNGKLELVVQAPSRGGYYREADDRTWEPYQSFISYPLIMADSQRDMVDLTGDGRADIVTFGDDTVVYYPSEGVAGFGPSVSIEQRRGFPAGTDTSSTNTLEFADMFGDGLMHRVLISKGLVVCWPNLGYGRFGTPVFMGDAPQYLGGLSASRVFLADTDGSGTADIIYVYPDRVDIYMNRSGNSFSAPVSIPLPEQYSELDQIMFSDIRGNGTMSMVFTKMTPEVHHYAYDFTSGDIGGTEKPYLLNDVDNNLGATTRIQYASSTKFYLDDKRAGKPWVTRLPFPVQVVEKVETLDRISGSKAVSSFSYHDGYFDPVEREFRGFGYVEIRDTQTFEEFSQPGLHSSLVKFNAGRAELHVAPMLTKRWYHTGAYIESGVISRQYEVQYYHGDSEAFPSPDSIFDPAIMAGDTEIIRQAYIALKGQLLREEVYGLDGSSREHNPFTVSEQSYAVRMIQPPDGTRYAVFLTSDREAWNYEYDREPTDPRIGQTLTLVVDEYANTTQTCQIFYPRRIPVPLPVSEDPANSIYPEQTTLHTAVEHTDVTNVVKGFRLLGIPWQLRSFELSGLSVPVRGYFTWEEVQQQVDKALADTIRFGEPFTPNEVQARLYSWKRMYYWGPEDVLPLSGVGAKALLFRIEEAVFPEQYVGEVYGDKVTSTMLSEEGGYVDLDGYWWNQAGAQWYYDTPGSFSRPWYITDPFGGRVTMRYDAYWLFLTRVEQLVENTLGEPIVNTVTAEYDYQTVKPQSVTNINGTEMQALFDPLGFVIVTSLHGVQDGQPSGDDNLDDYIRREDATFDDVLAQPHYYLEGATTFFYYDFLAWLERGEPTNSIELLRETHVSNLNPGQETAIQTQISYSDGFGRTIETKLKADPCTAVLRTPEGKALYIGDTLAVGASDECWIVSGRTVFNNKSLPVEQYLPYFSSTPSYEEYQDVYRAGVIPSPTVTRYDPLGRVVRVDTPKGFFLKTEYTPWVQRQYDEDDTVKQSPYYKEHFQDADPDEKDALEKASVFENTPNEDVLDNMGRRFLTVQINVWEEDDGTGTAVVKEGPVYLTTFYTLDIQGNVLSATDPRLCQLSPPVANIVSVYDMSGHLLKSTSVDAGEKLTLLNIFGNAVGTWDSRDFYIATTYDLLQRPVEIYVKGHDPDSDLTLDQVVERVVYGENAPDGEGKNLRGEPYRYYDQAGVLTFCSYDIQSHALRTERQVLKQYKKEANWDTIEGVELDDEVYPVQYAYDALSRLISEITPDGTQYTASYGIAGSVKKIDLIFADGTTQTVVEDITYDAAGERRRIAYGNGSIANYTYEEKTERLMSIYTTRPDPGETGTSVVQNIGYTYDPVGNVTRTRDYTHETIFCDQQMVEALSDYTYNAIYNLLRATGRQHPGIMANTHITGFKQTLFMPLCQTPHPNDMEKLQMYKEMYTYDDSGNLTTIRHYAPPGTPSWVRELLIPEKSNRAVPVDSPETTYDGNGNMLKLENLRQIRWNYRDNIAQVDVLERDIVTDPDSDYYVYDYAGNRVRKVVERYAFAGTVADVEDSIYIGNYIVRRNKKVSSSSEAIVSTRHSLRVMNGDTCVTIVETAIVEQSLLRDRTEERRFRYQLDNNLGSSVVELDESAKVISFEEYFPYGGTSVIAGDNEIEVSPKVFRYSGKEADDSTGLYYYGARYYISWLGRWVSPDPAGPVDGLNLYEFVQGNPLVFVDVGGLCKKKRAERSRSRSREKEKKKAPPKRKPAKSSRDSDSEDEGGGISDRVKKRARTRSRASSSAGDNPSAEDIATAVTALSAAVTQKRSEIQAIINKKMTKSQSKVDASNTNVEAMRVFMKNGSTHDHFAFSNMTRLREKSEKEGVDLVSDFVPGVKADTAYVSSIDKKKRGGQFDNHTEPKLLNFAIGNYTITDMAAIVLVGELAPCSDTCSHATLPSFVSGEVYDPSDDSKIDTTGIKLLVYNTDGGEYTLQRHEEHDRNEFLLKA